MSNTASDLPKCLQIGTCLVVVGAAAGPVAALDRPPGANLDDTWLFLAIFLCSKLLVVRCDIHMPDIDILVTLVDSVVGLSGLVLNMFCYTPGWKHNLFDSAHTQALDPPGNYENSMVVNDANFFKFHTWPIIQTLYGMLI
jgi:hypothetical protein